MIFSADFFPLWLTLSCSLIALAGIACAGYFAPWASLKGNSERQHLVFGASILLGLFWMLRIEALEVVTFHPLLITTATLLMGWSFAMLAGLIAQLWLLITGFDHGSTLGMNYLVTVMIPASVSFAIVKYSQRIALKNIFVYMLGAGFLGGALSSLAVAIATVTLLFVGGYDLGIAEVAKDAPFLLLVMFPEGFLNGMLITALTVFKPHLVKTFNEDFYLKDD